MPYLVDGHMWEVPKIRGAATSLPWDKDRPALVEA